MFPHAIRASASHLSFAPSSPSPRPMGRACRELANPERPAHDADHERLRGALSSLVSHTKNGYKRNYIITAAGAEAAMAGGLAGLSGGWS
ncbi:hypothetical protein BOSE62_50005 [Bosea sp. 62]|nr:hypothetical protein BOSE46_110211 [Bosea sp. 46]CAD5258833.1 hypothetical protein BOSE21B_110255 [Bosea sp. 21B]CAD5282040.1 hypothetical protein BOSE7B_40960 [Bosea sp. 7B]VVT51798.1 hypothetical protein BOS5A_110453 [Bosea sp. EC-HK365B]VXB42784.1 hypothetical protein BOSE29B_110210 [Bosea sp. 29B]VXC55265.1 hypothetical protein BOSE62_50005 [Bosea sp. 62]VXC60212.1 hypothetical protein BOSE125_30300 [Bosea sp. 125]VXC87261.1 hypothetical protein BOSE127_70004 [Bosea sp. 127]